MDGKGHKSNEESLIGRPPCRDRNEKQACQVEREGFPCSCGPSCENPEGSREFGETEVDQSWNNLSKKFGPHLMWRHNVMFPSCRWACTTSTRWWAWGGWWTCRRAARRASSAPSTSEPSSFNSIKRLKLSRSKRRCKEGKHTWCRETYISELNLIKKKTRWRWSLSILNLDATVYKIQLSVDDFGD